MLMKKIMKNNNSKPETNFPKAKLYDKYLKNCANNSFVEFENAYNRHSLEIESLEEKVAEVINNSDSKNNIKRRILKFKTITLINRFPHVRRRNLINNNLKNN